jgi:hypothetical protein
MIGVQISSINSRFTHLHFECFKHRSFDLQETEEPHPIRKRIEDKREEVLREEGRCERP